MTTGIDGFIQSPQAQEFWLRRFIAVLIDYSILFFPIYVISAVAWSVAIWGFIPWFASGALVLLYSALFEAELGYTIGKRVMGLEVVPVDGRPIDFPRAMVRNVSKLHPAFLLIDVLLGLFMEQKPNTRYLDTMTQCEVVDSSVAAQRRRDGKVPAPVGAGPTPRGVTVEVAPAEAGPTMPPMAPPSPPPPPPEQPRPLPTPPVEVARRPLEGTGEATAPPRRAPGIPPPTVPMRPPAPVIVAPAEVPVPPGAERMAGRGGVEGAPRPEARKPVVGVWEELGPAEELPDK